MHSKSDIQWPPTEGLYYHEGWGNVWWVGSNYNSGYWITEYAISLKDQNSLTHHYHNGRVKLIKAGALPSETAVTDRVTGLLKEHFILKGSDKCLTQ